MTEQYLRPKDISKTLGIGMTKTYELINRVDFPKVRIGKSIVIPSKQFEEYMNKWIGGRL